MKPKRNPIHKEGDRNLCCSYYEDCLDHAVKHRWQCWNCSECKYKVTRQETDAVCTIRDSDPYYELPPKLSREVWHRFG